MTIGVDVFAVNLNCGACVVCSTNHQVCIYCTLFPNMIPYASMDHQPIKEGSFREVYHGLVHKIYVAWLRSRRANIKAPATWNSSASPAARSCAEARFSIPFSIHCFCENELTVHPSFSQVQTQRIAKRLPLVMGRDATSLDLGHVVIPVHAGRVPVRRLHGDGCRR